MLFDLAQLNNIYISYQPTSGNWIYAKFNKSTLALDNVWSGANTSGIGSGQAFEKNNTIYYGFSSTSTSTVYVTSLTTGAKSTLSSNDDIQIYLSPIDGNVYGFGITGQSWPIEIYNNLDLDVNTLTISKTLIGKVYYSVCYDENDNIKVLADSSWGYRKFGMINNNYTLLLCDRNHGFITIDNISKKYSIVKENADLNLVNTYVMTSSMYSYLPNNLASL